MAKVVFPDHLMTHTDGVRELDIECRNFRSLVRALDQKWPGIEDVLTKTARRHRPARSIRTHGSNRSSPRARSSSCSASRAARQPPRDAISTANTTGPSRRRVRRRPC